MIISPSSSASGTRVPRSDIGSAPSDIRDEVLGLLPRLRAYALLLVDEPGRADDLVETTLRTALAEVPHMRAPPDLRVWLFTILRHAAHDWSSQTRRRTGKASAPSFRAGFRGCLGALPIHQRDAVLLVICEGFSNRDASAICGCSVGTIIRRLDRGRRNLARCSIEGQEMTPD